MNNTKQKIFSAAVDLISEKGYHRVSMKDIAKHVGIQPASIYNHYDSKEALFEDILDHYLARMENFYDMFHTTCANMSSTPKLEEMLEKLMLTYEPEEVPLMYKLTRIVHHEQFQSKKAAEALIGSGYRRYMEEHVHFFDRLSEMGLLKGKERNGYYGELFARLSLTFATQFLHPDVEPTIENQSELYRFMIPIIIQHEQNLAAQRERAPVFTPHQPGMDD